MNDSKNGYPAILNEFEEEQLLEQFNQRFISSFRNYTMVKLVLNTGLNSKELTNLKWDDVDLFSGEIHIKSDSIYSRRKLSISFEIIEMLEEWRERQDIEWGGSEYVFCTRNGDKLVQTYINDMLTTYKDKALIDKYVGVNTLRHTFGVKLYKECDDLNEVRDIMGLSHNSYHIMYYKVLAERTDLGYLI